MGPTAWDIFFRQAPKRLLGPRAKLRTRTRGACIGPLEWLEGAGKMGANMGQMFYNLNLRTVILQGESYLKKRKKEEEEK